jgi:hypothetical protein
VTFITDKNGAGFWIGANDKDIEDDWVWESNKSKLLFSDWQQTKKNRNKDKNLRKLEYSCH